MTLGSSSRRRTPLRTTSAPISPSQERIQPSSDGEDLTRSAPPPPVRVAAQPAPHRSRNRRAVVLSTPYVNREAPMPESAGAPRLADREAVLHALYEAAELEHNLMCT